MRAAWALIGIAGLTAASGTARAAAPADLPSPAVAHLSVDLGRLEPLGDPGGLAADDRSLANLLGGSLLPGLTAETNNDRFGMHESGNALRYRFGNNTAALSLIVTRRLLAPAALPRPGSRRARLLLPVWEQMAFGSWSIGGGAGAGSRESWRSGLSVIRTITPRLSLGAEFSHESADIIDGHANTRLGVGATYRLSGPLSLIVSGGPYVEHHGGTGVKAYGGLTIAF